MSWQHKVLGDDKNGYQIYEVYFRESENTARTENPVSPYGETLEDLHDELLYMLRAVIRAQRGDVLSVEDFDKKHLNNNQEGE